MAAGIGLAIAVLIGLRDITLAVMHNVTSAIDSVMTPRNEIAIGVLVLASAAVLEARQAAPVAVQP